MVIAIWSFFPRMSFHLSVGWSSHLTCHLVGTETATFPRAHFSSVHSFLATGELCPSPWTKRTITAALAHLGIPASSGSRRLLLVIFSDNMILSKLLDSVGLSLDRQAGFRIAKIPLGATTTLATLPHFLFERLHHTTLHETSFFTTHKNGDNYDDITNF